MGTETPRVSGDNWTLNYFNYFTEIEEHFQKARGTGLFLMSPLDWALIESWKESGVPLEAVLRGIDGAFENGGRENRRPRRSIRWRFARKPCSPKPRGCRAPRHRTSSPRSLTRRKS